MPHFSVINTWACGEQTGEETISSDLTEFQLCGCCLQDRRCLSLQEGHACSGETQKCVNIVSTVCTGMCFQLYLANLQTGIRAEQLDIILYVMFPFFLSCKPFCLLCKLGICYHDSIALCLELVIAFFRSVFFLFRGDLDLICSGWCRSI